MDAANTLPTTVALAKEYTDAALQRSFLVRSVNVLDILRSAAILAAVYIVTTVIYNLWFHPLRNFPGPLLARSSLLWRLIHTISGRIHLSVQEQHKKYGPVFRVSPNELSFGSVSSFKTIYGHPIGNKPTFAKSEFYDVFGSGFNSRCIGSERNPQRHGQMKRNLTAAFSSKALLEQEHIVSQCIDGFVEKVGEIGKGGKVALDASKWFEMISFDILGEMAFGESFGCIESGKPHFWQELILSHLFFVTVVDNLRRYPFVPTIARLLFPFTTSVRDKHTGYVRSKVSHRLSQTDPRHDFLSNVAGKVSSGDVSREEMNAHASTLVIAGGETVSTFMAACAYYLLSNPEAYTKLKAEIRGAFDKYENIDMVKAQRLPYLAAVISEGLRIYPPGSQGFERLSPGAEVDGYYIPKGSAVYTSAWTVARDPTNFRSPEKFLPERWMGGEMYQDEVKEASQPFSLGPRGCIGRNFAMMEINLMMTKMHWKYDLELEDPNLDWERNSHCHVMWWRPHLKIRFKPRVMN